jgi:hypothetical protein
MVLAIRVQVTKMTAFEAVPTKDPEFPVFPAGLAEICCAT